jgi:hypothetical protein
MASEAMLFEIVFDVGDFSLDGHEKGVGLVVRCNRDADAIAEAYHEACRRFGFVLHDRVAREYEDRSITEDDLARIKEVGWQVPDDFDREWLQPEWLLSMMFHFVRSVDGDFAYEFVEREHFFKCGLSGRNFGLGYGLFA